MPKLRSRNDRFPDEHEIAGFIELGMRREALDAASRVLKRENPAPGEIREAINAIGVFASKMATWKTRIDAMISGLSMRTRHHARQIFLVYFNVIGEHARAAEFIHATGSFSPASNYFAVDSLLELGRVEDAEEVLRKMRISPADAEDAAAGEISRRPRLV